MIDWLTNEPTVAERLRKVDEHDARLRAQAADYPLKDKIAAYRRADEIREQCYAAIRADFGDAP